MNLNWFIYFLAFPPTVYKMKNALQAVRLRGSRRWRSVLPTSQRLNDPRRHLRHARLQPEDEGARWTLDGNDDGHCRQRSSWRAASVESQHSKCSSKQHQQVRASFHRQITLAACPARHMTIVLTETITSTLKKILLFHSFTTAIVGWRVGNFCTVWLSNALPQILYKESATYVSVF